VRTGLAITVLVGSWLSAALILLAASYPSGSLLVALVGFGVLLLTGAAWLVLVITDVAVSRFLLAATAAAVMVIVVGGSAVAARIELPLMARFALDRSAFEDVVAARGEVGPDAPCPSRIGTYRISACRTIGSDTYFTERDGGFLDSVGFVYLPEGPPADPPTSTSITYSQLRGPWYWFVEAW
jgi:hypothetical protein